MSGLVGYDSSEDEDETKPEKPPKMAKLEPSAPVPGKRKADHQAQPYPQSRNFNTLDNRPPSAPRPETSQDTIPGPAASPSAPTRAESVAAITPSADDGPPLSPNAYERQRLRELTMPTVPNFDIPDSPPPPEANSEEGQTLAATTKKLEQFLELKKQGVHFNERLQNSVSLRNPSLLPKLIEFAGISQEDSYASTLPGDLGLPAKWPEECYVEGLLKANEMLEKKRLAERDKVDFVPASKSTASSATGTPASVESENRHRKSRFDKK